MEIRRKRTEEGYSLWLVCELCHREVRRLDPQQPLWLVPVLLDEHKVKTHRLSTSDDAVGKMYYKHPDRQIETLELPDM